MAKLFLLITCIWSNLASSDPLNTYQFNRRNYLWGNQQMKKGPWFEWWYYKVVLPETNAAFFFVYGVVNPWDTGHQLAGTSAYVAMGDFTNKQFLRELHDVENFSASYQIPWVQIKDQLATDQYLQGKLVDRAGKISHWDIAIKKKWAFNPLGWSTGKVITDIEWYVAQADALCSGVISSNGQLYQFTDAPCYQDRNWGRAFPDWWAWIVANYFPGHPDTALAIGGGKPAVWGMNVGIEGVAVGLKHRGKTYQFRPHQLDDIAININFGRWEVVAANSRYKLEVSAYAPPEEFMDLPFQTPFNETFHDLETLTGELTVKLYRKKRGLGRWARWELLETLHSQAAGIEYGSFNLGNKRQNIFSGQFQLYSTPNGAQ